MWCKVAEFGNTVSPRLIFMMLSLATENYSYFIREEAKAQRLHSSSIWQNWESGETMGVGEGTVREFGMHMYTLLYLKWITNKD